MTRRKRVKIKQAAARIREEIEMRNRALDVLAQLARANGREPKECPVWSSSLWERIGLERALGILTDDNKGGR